MRASELGGDKTAPRGTVRITASEIMGVAVLPEILASIRLAYPEIIFELALNNRTDDLLRRDADIAMRMVRPTQDGHVAKKDRGGSVATVRPAPLSRSVQDTGEEELTKAHLIGFDRDDFSARSFAAGILPISRDLFSFRCDIDSAQHAAVTAGLGIGVMQIVVARRNADLVSVLAGHFNFKLDVWLAVHQDQRDQPAIRAVFDGLAKGGQVRYRLGLTRPSVNAAARGPPCFQSRLMASPERGLCC